MFRQIQFNQPYSHTVCALCMNMLQSEPFRPLCGPIQYIAFVGGKLNIVESESTLKINAAIPVCHFGMNGGFAVRMAPESVEK